MCTCKYVATHYENTDKGEKELEKWAQKHYFCRKHTLKPRSVGWDKEKGEKVLENPNPKKKKALKKVIAKKTKKTKK